MAVASTSVPFDFPAIFILRTGVRLHIPSARHLAQCELLADRAFELHAWQTRSEGGGPVTTFYREVELSWQ